MAKKKSIKNSERKTQKKKEYDEEDEGEKETGFSISSDVKRGVAAVFLFLLALITALGFFGLSGSIGNYFNKITGNIFGWAKLIFPLFAVYAGIVLMFRKAFLFYFTKILGLITILVFITGFFHWFYEADEMAKMASQGVGGGYVGYGVAYFSMSYLGKIGSLIAILAFIFVGTIVTFEFSIVDFFARFKKSKLEIDSGEVGDLADAIDAPNESGDTLGDEAVSIDKLSLGDDGEKIIQGEIEEEPDGESNIGHIEFVEGRDQYVSQEIIDSAANEKGAEKSNLGIDKNKVFRTARRGKWKMPPLDILESVNGDPDGGDVQARQEVIKNTLKNFGIEVEIGGYKVGPAVTQFSFRPAVGVKIAQILALQNDLALALAVHPIRIEAPIPGQAFFGVEVPNISPATVRLRGILEDKNFRNKKSNLTLALGKDVSGTFLFGNLEKMPHLMIAGATGTGKSVCINSIITSLLYQNSPEDLRFIMIDPKRVELSLYNGIPHLLTDVVMDNNKVINTLKWAVGEMRKRYRILQEVGSRDIISYKEKRKNGEKKKYTDPNSGETVFEEMENLPYIVILIDELADLMISHGKEIEGAIVSIAQMARAVGIHLIISTQRPSVEVITGLIKANITTRIAFKVATQIDSRTILDMAGAEKLLGNGDMLYLSGDSSKPTRIQGVFVSEGEVNRVVDFMKKQKEDLRMEEDEGIGEDITGSVQENLMEFGSQHKEDNGGDELFEAAKKEVIQAKKASASLLQRRLRVGYARAARLLDILEEKGIIGPPDGARPREVYLLDKEEISYEDSAEDQQKREKWEM